MTSKELMRLANSYKTVSENLKKASIALATIEKMQGVMPAKQSQKKKKTQKKVSGAGLENLVDELKKGRETLENIIKQ
jgi:uncharacterized protein YicC (UPF0701 family)